MAQVTRNVEAHVDYLLDYLLSRWQEIPVIADEWRTWDAVQKEVFDLEWGLKEERLDELESYANGGKLTAEQVARYAKLRDMVAAQRAVLERLLGN